MIRIAMWSGPRNLSTAMMRSFGARDDTACIDEPFYAAFLQLSGADHPMREETLAAHEVDAGKVAWDLAHGDRPAEVFYQKHMTHHMVAGIPRGWMADVTNVFLIRHPFRVLQSYAKKRAEITLDDIGFVQQTDLFHEGWALAGRRPVVIDADDILSDPRRALASLCTAIGIPPTDGMLRWAAGPRPEDGAWAPHWYDGVWSSTGFAPPPAPVCMPPEGLEDLAETAMPHYTALKSLALAI